MRNNNKKRKLMLLILLILGISVGFALLSTVLNINGIAGIKGNKWDIHWENVQPNNNSTVIAQKPVISDNATRVTYIVNLELPGDYYEFTVDAVNDGTFDGEITKIDHHVYASDGVTETTLPNYLISTIYYDGTTTPPALGDILEANGGTQTYRIRIEFDSEATTVPVDDTTYVIEDEITYSPKKKTNCDTNEIGDIVKFNPVSNSFCEENVGSTCYDWMIINKEDSKYSLFLLSDNAGEYVNTFAWSDHDPSKSSNIRYNTANWSNSLTIDPKYDVYVNDNFSIKFSEYKFRLMLRSEYDNLSADKKSELMQYCGGKYHTQGCALLDMENEYTNVIAGGTSINRSYPFSAMPQATQGYSIDARPVLDVDVQSCKKVATCTDFSNDSWATIKANADSNPTRYPIGCTKEIDLGTYGKHNVRVANNTKTADCDNSSFSQSSCGLVLEFEDILYMYVMGPDAIGPDDVGYGNKGGWPNAALKLHFIDTNIYNALPSDVKSAIKPTKTISGYGEYDSANHVSTDNLFLLAPHEIWENVDSATLNQDTGSTYTRQLDYYKWKGVTLPLTNNKYAIKKYNGSAYGWWTRSAVARTVGGYFVVIDTGYWGATNRPDSAYGVSPAFRVG